MIIIVAGGFLLGTPKFVFAVDICGLINGTEKERRKEKRPENEGTYGLGSYKGAIKGRASFYSALVATIAGFIFIERPQNRQLRRLTYS